MLRRMFALIPQWVCRMTLPVVGPALLAAAPASAQAVQPYRVEGLAIEQPLSARGDASRGRALLVARDPANCILCHAAPADLMKSGVRFSGNLAPSLDGAGARWTPGQLRLRIVDSRRLNPDTIMPSYYRTDGLVEVATAWRGKPILNPQQIEDLIAYLVTLQ
jgi:sulfur-oxidizing protein SoxX